MSREKIILGGPRYGYDWTMNNGTAVSVTNAIGLALRYQVPIQYSSNYAQPSFTYWDENGNRHIVWFENAQARVAKLQLVVDYQLRGVGAWQLGLDFPQSYFLVNEFFDTRKVF